MRPEPYLGAFADLFYPQRCVGCRNRASDVLCRVCFEALPWVGEPCCRRCGIPTAFDVYVCEECKGVDFGFESARASLRYEGVGKQIVHALKYGSYFPVVEKLMVPMMHESLMEDVDLVVPIPLHPSRLRTRGFNQAELMARGLAEKIRAPVSDRLQSVRRTRDQVDLTVAERRANVEGAFQARTAARGRILLVDDVFTTGATLSAAAKELHRAGAECVHAISLCRTC